MAFSASASRLGVMRFQAHWGPLRPVVLLVAQAGLPLAGRTWKNLGKKAMSDLAPLSFAEAFTRPLSSTTSSPPEGDLLGAQESSSVSVDEVIRSAESALELRKKSSGPVKKISSITIDRKVGEFCNNYVNLSSTKECQKVLQYLSGQSVDREFAKKVAHDYSDINQQDGPLSRLEDQLRLALTPDFIWLFQKIGQIPEGVKFLVDLRSHLIGACKAPETESTREALKAMNSQLQQLLSMWFSVGLLEIEQITWNSPCAMLQKISEYESVHPMRNWTDLKARVGPYRRCFVLTHRSMPGEPIVVLHVALTQEIPESIAFVIKHHRLVKRFTVDSQQAFDGSKVSSGEDVSLCRAAIFYSITSTQTGLQGIELGTSLIKQAVHKLKEELPNLIHFSTLSPIPGFRAWLLGYLLNFRRGELDVEDLFSRDDLEIVRKSLQTQASSNEVLMGELHELIRSHRWAEDPHVSDVLQTPLMRLCARYLYVEKRRGLALDSVANFHLRNGAVMWRLNWRGDMSARGLDNSCGMMVNYKYFLDDLEKNSTAYQEKNFVKAGEQVIQLASKWRPTREN